MTPFKIKLSTLRKLRKRGLTKKRYRDLDFSEIDFSFLDFNYASFDSASFDSARFNYARFDSARFDSARFDSARINKFALRILFRMLRYKFLPKGDLIVYKKTQSGVGKLLIPKDAKRTGGLIGNKFRASKAISLTCEGLSKHTSNFRYNKGAEIIPDKYDPNPFIECSNGIHFFLTKREAKQY